MESQEYPGFTPEQPFTVQEPMQHYSANIGQHIAQTQQVGEQHGIHTVYGNHGEYYDHNEPSIQTNEIQNTNYANIVHQIQQPAALVQFAHAALFSPTITTLEKAIKNNFLVGFPGLNQQSIKDHPPHSIPTIKGHLDQNRKNKQSTKGIATPLPLLPDYPEYEADNQEVAIMADNTPNQEEPTNYVFATFLPTERSGKIFTDQTGKFPIVSSAGNTQIFVLYDYDSNSIHAQPMQIS
jgi:hypothetical protein